MEHGSSSMHVCFRSKVSKWVSSPTDGGRLSKYVNLRPKYLKLHKLPIFSGKIGLYTPSKSSTRNNPRPSFIIFPRKFPIRLACI
ncbi:hypothetical protein HanPI659440_Chr14g0527361 [Helianthus annuus]|uniref:Uncharacterized protein n=1 Tax=Helianthus annuus TaxID=4232 RepID=A0A9K3E5H6_HELAN|nr:hypothetical protein HanXRQr2_Chr14g0623451 [Helianthus annuus]KAJ0702257.1 hypothetical protein HanPI659440_Chr14g0527361 [Helianthus annuus]KAJ0838733.1 hypothetical protein HanPSC8_Chr14g0598281 [Helianthus annuus]